MWNFNNLVNEMPLYCTVFLPVSDLTPMIFSWFGTWQEENNSQMVVLGKIKFFSNILEEIIPTKTTLITLLTER